RIFRKVCRKSAFRSKTPARESTNTTRRKSSSHSFRPSLPEWESDLPSAGRSLFLMAEALERFRISHTGPSLKSPCPSMLNTAPKGRVKFQARGSCHQDTQISDCLDFLLCD